MCRKKDFAMKLPPPLAPAWLAVVTIGGKKGERKERGRERKREGEREDEWRGKGEKSAMSKEPRL
jgi:hypothetical protein